LFCIIGNNTFINPNFAQVLTLNNNVHICLSQARSYPHICGKVGECDFVGRNELSAYANFNDEVILMGTDHFNLKYGLVYFTARVNKVKLEKFMRNNEGWRSEPEPEILIFANCYYLNEYLQIHSAGKTHLMI
jgi:hypothetical protein